MPRPKFFGVIKDGKLAMHDSAAFVAYIRNFPEAKEMEVVIGARSKQRSLNQNSYYWGVVLATISAGTGHTCDELHEIFKRMFLAKRIVQYRDKSIAMPGSTPDQNTAEFTDYIERIRAEASTMGIVVPDPSRADVTR